MGIVAMLTTYYVYCRRKPEQRPKFVKIQLWLMQGVWIFMMAYFISEITMPELNGHQQQQGEDKHHKHQTWISNLLATICDLMLMTYDWLFFEQYLSAGLIMPIAMDMYGDY